MITLNMPQRSAEWYEARRGLPTASRFASILTPKTGVPSKAQDTLINELIQESVIPLEEVPVQQVSDDMEYGIRLEAEARCSYELEHATGKMTEVGFLIHDTGLFGGSPDCLVGENGGVEIKCPAPKTHIGYVREGILPDDYKCQVHGHLIVTGREWWDFWSYCRHFDPFLIRVTRDEFTAKLDTELRKFCIRYNEVRAQFKLPPMIAKRAA